MSETPKEPEEVAQQAEPQQAEAPKAEGETVKLKYSGPSGQVVRGLNAKLEEGQSYDVPAEIAEGLVAGSKFWEK